MHGPLESQAHNVLHTADELTKHTDVSAGACGSDERILPSREKLSETH